MKLYILKNKKQKYKQNRLYKKLFEGPRTQIYVSKNLKDKLNKYVDEISVFEKIEDIIVFAVYLIKENKSLYKYHSTKIIKIIDELKKQNNMMVRRIEYYKEQRDYWKNKYKNKK